MFSESFIWRCSHLLLAFIVFFLTINTGNKAYRRASMAGLVRKAADFFRWGRLSRRTSSTTTLSSSSDRKSSTFTPDHHSNSSESAEKFNFLPFPFNSLTSLFPPLLLHFFAPPLSSSPFIPSNYLLFVFSLLFILSLHPVSSSLSSFISSILLLSRVVFSLLF